MRWTEPRLETVWPVIVGVAGVLVWVSGVFVEAAQTGSIHARSPRGMVETVGSTMGSWLVDPRLSLYGWVGYTGLTMAVVGFFTVGYLIRGNDRNVSTGTETTREDRAEAPVKDPAIRTDGSLAISDQKRGAPTAIGGVNAEVAPEQRSSNTPTTVSGGGSRLVSLSMEETSWPNTGDEIASEMATGLPDSRSPTIGRSFDGSEGTTIEDPSTIDAGGKSIQSPNQLEENVGVRKRLTSVINRTNTTVELFREAIPSPGKDNPWEMKNEPANDGGESVPEAIQSVLEEERRDLTAMRIQFGRVRPDYPVVVRRRAAEVRENVNVMVDGVTGQYSTDS